MTASQMRVIGWIGVGATLVFVAAFALDPTPPGAGSQAAAVTSHLASFAGADRAAAFLFALSGAGLIVFIAGVRQWFESISSAPGWWAAAMFAGAVATGTMLAMTSAVFFAAASQTGTSPDVARFVNDLINYGFVFSGFGSIVMVGSMTAMMLGTGGSLALLGRLGLAVCALQALFLATAFFTSGPLGAGGLVTIVGFAAAGVFVFLTAVSVLMFARLMAAAARPAR